MSGDESIWVGADPGGKNNFGVAILWADGSVCTACVSCADEAVDVVCQWVEGSSPAGSAWMLLCGGRRGSPVADVSING